MDYYELHELIRQVQQHRMEPDAIEVKTARGGTPKVFDSLSAFANRPGGGVILFGLDERQGFAVVGVGNAQRVQEEVAGWARDEMEPPVTVEFTVDEIEGHTVLALEVSEIPNERKPCFYKPKGLRGNGGAYIRCGGTDRSMTDYEIFGYVSGRTQSRFDEDVMTEATLEDLDLARLKAYVDQLRASRPQAGYLDSPLEEVLKRLAVCKQIDDQVNPTLAGLMMFGKYPQEFFPQLMITFVQYYGTIEGEHTPRGERFVDNQRFEGPVPEMIERTLTYVMTSMRKSSLIDGLLRQDIPEYPQEALREAIANAVAHRDYSSHVRGSYVQVRMFANRLEIQSPGGLYGNVTIDNLEEEHSTRNVRLMRMMEDLHLVENRGSGIKAMLSAMRAANLEPPQFDDRRASFKVTFHNHTMMNPEAIAWLNQFANKPLNDRQRVALVYVRQHEKITNNEYRRLNRVDALCAGQELRGLVETGLIEQGGIGRWTNYQLIESLKQSKEQVPANNEARILSYVRENGSATNEQCRTLLGLEGHQIYYLLKKLCDEGQLKPSGKGRWRKYIVP
jgi:ATP-dependent DNA helicase RecG